jgi:hypothetical protein
METLRQINFANGEVRDVKFFSLEVAPWGERSRDTKGHFQSLTPRIDA